MQTDEQLMKMYQNGSMAAFEELYSRYTSRVYSYLRKRLADTDGVDDVYQKVFLKLHENREKYDSKYLFAPWLFTLTRHVLIDWYRLKKDTPVEKIEVLVDMQEIQEVVPEETYDASIKELLAELPDKYKEMIELRYVEDLEFSEIAERLKLKESNVRKIVSRGVLKLRQRLAGDKNEA